MSDKQTLITQARAMYEQWEALLGGMTEDEITASRAPDMSVRDTVAHLWSWQQVTLARLEAARDDHEPRYPHWSLGKDPDECDTDETNARNAAASAGMPWSDVYTSWRTQFQQIIAVADSLPADDLETVGRYAWFYDEFPLGGVLEGTYEHHEEHLDTLRGNRMS